MEKNTRTRASIFMKEQAFTKYVQKPCLGIIKENRNRTWTMYNSKELFLIYLLGILFKGTRIRFRYTSEFSVEFSSSYLMMQMIVKYQRGRAGEAGTIHLIVLFSSASLMSFSVGFSPSKVSAFEINFACQKKS